MASRATDHGGEQIVASRATDHGGEQIVASRATDHGYVFSWDMVVDEWDFRPF